MAKEEFDVIVVGGGPGGSTCSGLMKKHGLSVLLLEKSRFPRDKICGDAISGKSMSVIRELGWDKDLEKKEHEKIEGVIFSSPDGTEVTIPFNMADSPARTHGYVARREVADNIWFQNAKKVVDKCIENFIVTDLLKNGEQIIGVKGINKQGKEQEFYSKIVIGADGANSIVANKLGLVDRDPEHLVAAIRVYYDNIEDLTDNIELHFIDETMPGYFWIFPIEDGKANVGAGMLASEMRKKNVNLKEAMFDAIENNPLFKKRFKNAKQLDEVKGWNLPLGSKIRKCHGPGYMLIGDAASLIDPFTGEGVGNAMFSGRLAAKYAKQAIKTNDLSANFLSQYEKELRQLLTGELKTSRRLQIIGRNYTLLNFIVKKAAAKQEVAKIISGMLANEDAKQQFFSPLFYLRLLLT